MAFLYARGHRVPVVPVAPGPVIAASLRAGGAGPAAVLRPHRVLCGVVPPWGLGHRSPGCVSGPGLCGEGRQDTGEGLGREPRDLPGREGVALGGRSPTAEARRDCGVLPPSGGKWAGVHEEGLGVPAGLRAWPLSPPCAPQGGLPRRPPWTLRDYGRGPRRGGQPREGGNLCSNGSEGSYGPTPPCVPGPRVRGHLLPLPVGGGPGRGQRPLQCGLCPPSGAP